MQHRFKARVLEELEKRGLKEEHILVGPRVDEVRTLIEAIYYEVQTLELLRGYTAKSKTTTTFNNHVESWFVGMHQRTDSPIERKLKDAMNTRRELRGEFETQYEVGPYYLDFGFPDIKLCVEADGREYHCTPAQILHDNRRDAFLGHLGWTVLRFTGSEIYRDAYECADRVSYVARILRGDNDDAS
jgi:very-short-patch-repair endonuclease